MLEQSYERSARQETDDTAQFALMQIQTELENAINDSKSVSYDGVIRSAYRNYRENGNKITLYRSVNDYLRDSFSRSVLGSSEDIQLQLDGLSFVRSGADGWIAEAERDGGYRYEATADGHPPPPARGGSGLQRLEGAPGADLGGRGRGAARPASGPGLPGGSRDGQIELFVIYC